MAVGADEDKQQAITELLTLAGRSSAELAGAVSPGAAVGPGPPAWWDGDDAAGSEALAMVRSRPGRGGSR